jgi:hypothetical protein
VHNVSDVRKIEVHTAEPSVPGPSPLEVEFAIAKLKKYKSSGRDQIPAGGETLQSMIQKLNTLWNTEDLPDQLKESTVVPIHKKGDETDCNNYRGISLLSTSYKILSNIFLSRSSLYIDEIIGDHQCGFRCNRTTTDQFSAFIRYWRKSGSTMRQYRYSS